MVCNLEQRDGKWYCTECNGLPLKEGNYKRVCKADGPSAKPQPPGVGHYLKLLLAHFHLLGKAGCGCDAHAASMDRNGPDWCAENIDTIIGWMRAEAKKRKLPFTAVGARILIRRAIRNARLNACGGVEL